MIALGNRIVEELKLQEGVDTLAKWMANHLAQLITQATVERDAARRKKLCASCCALIERLWKNRANLPGGAKPLGRIDEQLIAIQTMMKDFGTTPDSYLHQAKQISNPWLVFAIDSHSIDRRMAAIAVLASFLESDLRSENRWMVENSGQISKEEHEILNALDRWVGRKNEFFVVSTDESIVGLKRDERKARLLEELAKALENQRKALKTLKESLPPSHAVSKRASK